MTERGTFDQAQALIRRVGEAAGGSADAYEIPFRPTGPVGTPHDPQAETEPEIDSDGVGCLEGVVDWDEVRDRISTSPPPISDEYRLQGVVEDAGSAELEVVYEGFLQARNDDQPQIITLETGQYRIERAASEGRWQLHDTAKDFLYLQDHPVEHLGVKASDMFIWVQTFEAPVKILGYIHMGYVMIRA